MIRRISVSLAAVLLLGAAPYVTSHFQPGDPAERIAQQRKAMEKFALLDGQWRGEAWAMGPDGQKHTLTQTERVGPFLDGSVRVIEGRGYDADGSVSFNALGIISFDPDKRAYAMHSYAQGHEGDFVITPTENGFTWEIPAGPMKMSYTAQIIDGTWHEVGDRIMPGRDPVRFYEMTLKRIGESKWPSDGVVPRE